MARIRSIKPEWLEDEIATLGSDTRVMSIALILLADDYGNGRANDVILAGKVFPGEDEAWERTRECLARLSGMSRNQGFITIYEVRGQRYYSIRNWKLHQKVDHPGKPMVPGPSEAEKTINPDSYRMSRATLASPRENLATDQDQDRDQDRERDQGSKRAAPRSGSGEDQAPAPRAGPSKKNPRRKPDTARLVEAKTRAASKVASKGVATRKQRQANLPALPAIEVVFTGEMPEADQQALLDQIEGKHGVDRKKKAVALVTDEVLRLYRAERKRVTGNSYAKVDAKARAALLDIAVGCIGYRVTPERLFTWWQEPGNNWTDMDFPSLGFMATAKNLDRAAAAMGGKRRQQRAGGHGYDDPGKLDPRVRPTLRGIPSVVDVDKISNAQLLTIQNAAKAMAAGRAPGMSKETEELATLIKPLFAKG